jgi:Xaa-Pro aminopeptidase
MRLLHFLLLGLVASASARAAPPPAPEVRRAEIAGKEARLASWLEQQNLDGVLLGTQRNFAWLTAGGDNHVVFNTEDGVAWLLWTPARKHVITANNEMPRFMDEELAGLGYEPAPFLWHADLAAGARATLIAGLTAGKRIGCDLPLAGTTNIGAAFGVLRAQFAPGEIERYRWLARTAAEIVESAAREVRPGQTEQIIQAGVARRLFAEDILPTVLLVAADERIARYKHPITKEAVVHREAMITLCARKWGLVVAVTRHVHFGHPAAEMLHRQEELGTIFAAMLGATRIGATSGDVVAAARHAYASSGFAGEWEAHHLGGALGYRERDYKAYPGSDHPILDRQAFAWNPTLPGVKAEDTVLLLGDTLEVLTDTGSWPRAAFEAGGRSVNVPRILIQGAQ